MEGLTMDFDVIILAGGLGTRLRGVIGEVPKCLAPVCGKPFLYWVLEYLAKYGPSKVTLSVGYLKNAVEEMVRSDAGRFPFDIEFSEEDEPLGTGGGIRLALGRCNRPRTLILNGDTFFNVDLKALLSSPPSPVRLCLKPMRDFDRYGEVVLEGDRITAFREKKPCMRGLVNGGAYLCDTEFLKSSLAPLPAAFSFEKDFLEPLSASEGKALSGFVSDDYFIDIGVPEDYARASQELPQVALMMETAQAAKGYKTVFLDRDGVINRQIEGDYVRSAGEFEFRPGIFDFLRRLSGSRVIVVTNQRGVGRGLMSLEALEDIHGKMVSEIRAAGGRIDKVYSCTSADASDPCRKPGTGMFLEAKRDYPDIEASSSVMIGDSDSDREFAAACGMEYIGVPSFR